jgi:hypothetical protein
MLKKNAIKKIIKKIMWNIKLHLSNFIYRNFKKPIQEKKEKILIEKAKKELIKNFENNIGVKHKAVLRLNDIVNKDFSLGEKQKYLNDKLKEGARAMVSYTNKSPMYYDPEIVNIHNEFNELRETPTFKNIIEEENDLNSQRLREQEYQFYRKNYSKEKKLNLLKKRFGI